MSSPSPDAASGPSSVPPAISVGSPRDRFLRRLAAGPLLADGGLGTLLFSRGVPQRACLEGLATDRPELVGAAHREYVDAGAELITTLTLGANRHRLAAFGRGADAARLNRRAAQLAREARDVAGREVLVAGSIGPIGVPSTSSRRSMRRPGGRCSGSRSTGCSRVAPTSSCSRRTLRSTRCCGPSTKPGARRTSPSSRR